MHETDGALEFFLNRMGFVKRLGRLAIEMGSQFFPWVFQDLAGRRNGLKHARFGYPRKKWPAHLCCEPGHRHSHRLEVLPFLLPLRQQKFKSLCQLSSSSHLSFGRPTHYVLVSYTYMDAPNPAISKRKSKKKIMAPTHPLLSRPSSEQAATQLSSSVFQLLI
jgi:hypothetical protein